MKNLFKNVVRSFKKNKISIIGLVFLLFFGLGVFCTMSNTTANITNQYNSIANKGNLHDFTASELYEIGNAAYVCTDKGFTYNEAGSPQYQALENISVSAKTTKELFAGDFIEAGHSETFNFVIPKQVINKEGTVATRTYHLKLSETQSTGLYKDFAKTGAPETELDVVIPEQITGSGPTHVRAIQDLQGEISGWTEAKMSLVANGETVALQRVSGNALFVDYNSFLNQIDERTKHIYDLITTKDTPLIGKMKEYSDRNEITFRRFNSINVTASKDNIFYKVINSNPTDTINKIVLFKDPQGQYGNQLFDTQDWAPFNSKIEFFDLDGNIVPAGTDFDGDFTVPSTFEQLVLITPFEMTSMGTWSPKKKFVYSQIMHIRFKRMFAGDRTTVHGTLEGFLSTLSAITMTPQAYYDEFYKDGSDINGAYVGYYDHRQPDWWNENIIISMNGNIVINWSTPTPLSCTMVNWTSHFSVVNPQHLSATKKHVISPYNFNNFEPYKEWYKVYFGEEPKNEIKPEIVKAWFNTLTNKQFNFWWNPSALTDVNEMEYIIYNPDGSEHSKITVYKGTEKGQWNGVSKESIASCGEYNQIIWGCGLTPDFMYPVVTATRPTPNVKTECLTYCNESGYKALRLAFFNSPTEDFLVAKFMPSVTTTRQQQIIDELNTFCSGTMLYPKDMKAVYRANDTKNILNSSAFRVSYIPNLVNVIKLVTIILSVFLAILALVICLIIIKRYVENNRVNIGIMRANGISKIKIALSLLPFALFPAIIGGVAAYLVGLFLQIPMLKLFGNYWTLPTPILSFDWISMVTCIVLPFVLFGIITILSSLWVLRTKSVELMKSGSEFKTNSFSKVAKKPFRHFGVLTRFRVALAFNSLTRLIMLALMSCLTMTSLVFVMTTFGKLGESKAINSTQFDYKFNLQLATPTTAGGNYNVEDWSNNEGFGYTNPEQYIYNLSWQHSDRQAEKNLTKWYSDAVLSLSIKDQYRANIGVNGNLMLPTVADATGQKTDLQYLINKTCSKFTLDYVIGLGSMSSNPWEIAIALMPANSRNMASTGYNYIVNRIGEIIDNEDDPKHNDWIQYKDYFAQKEDPESGKMVLVKPYAMDEWTRSWLSGFDADYVKFLVDIYRDPEFMANEYRISYGIVPINWNYETTVTKKDETYSYLTGPITSISSKQRTSFDKTHEITIEGIPDRSQFIKLTDKNGVHLNGLLYDESVFEDDVRPVIINAFAAHKYNLGVGGTFSITATNTADRYDRKINPEYDKTDKSNQIKFRVVGISQGTSGEAFYCTQKDANKVLGLPDGSKWNKTHKYMLWQEQDSDETRVIDLSCIDPVTHETGDVYYVYKVDTDGTLVPEGQTVNKFPGAIVPVGFNGIYTADPKGRPLTNGLSLYSNTGLYPGASVYNSDAMRTLLSSGKNVAIANFISGINNADVANAFATGNIDEAVKKMIDELIKYYGDTTMVTCIVGATDVAASDLIYNNLISTFNLAQTTIMSVVIPITIIVVGIISNLIINDSRKMAAMLKALGYSDKKNAMSILALFIPTIVLGLALAVPLTMGVAVGYQSLIFGNANILIDVSRKWWYYLASVGGIGIVLVATYAVGLVSLKRDRLVDQIKG